MWYWPPAFVTGPPHEWKEALVGWIDLADAGVAS
jgi:hypothetical protein